MLRKGLLRRALAPLALCALSPLAPPAAPAQAPAGLSFVGAPPPLTLTAARGHRADLDLILRNSAPRGGALRVRYFTDDGTVVAAGAGRTAGLRLDLAPGTRDSIPGYEVQPLRVRLFAQGGRPEAVRGGTLVVDVPANPSLGAATATVAPPPAAKPGFYQDDVEVTVTRGNLLDAILPRSLGGGNDGDLVVPVKGPGSVASTARLVSSRGGHVTVALVDGQDQATLRVTGDPQPGKYAGKLRPPGVDPLGVTVHVQDWFLYPLLAVLAGAFAAWLLTYVYEKRSRPRWVTERALSDARDRYRAIDPPPALVPLDFDARLDAVLAQLRRARYQDDFTAASTAAAELVATVDRWGGLAKSLRDLTKALDDLRQVEPEPPKRPPTAQADAAAMLAGRFAAEDAERAGADKRLLDAQTSVVAAYVEALDKPDTDPAAIYADYPAAVQRSDEQTAELLRRLRLGPAAEEEPGEVRGVAAPAPAGAPLERPADIERRLRLADYVAFLTQAAIVVGVYMLGIYSGQDFGGWDDYAIAFGAGVLGQVAIPWDALPLVRSIAATRS